MFAAKAIFALTLAALAIAAPIVDRVIEEPCVGAPPKCLPPRYVDGIANKRATVVQARVLPTPDLESDNTKWSIGRRQLDHSNGWILWTYIANQERALPTAVA
ncbi:hypothetical protein DFH09DRAFT_1161383 [Mycena vulgaris]|nr:hypothetical protein DFH09DRAFT_1161383 [Mycena vulgaris]